MSSGEATIRKVLSANDLGLTGSHQAGVLVPRYDSILRFFPILDPEAVNPSRDVLVRDVQSDSRVLLRFVYYNSKVRGEGTRNEYRLTRMTALLRSLDARPGDVLVFRRTGRADIELFVEKGDQPDPTRVSRAGLVLRGGWTVLED